MAMAAVWDDMGRASNVLQLLGVDAFGLVSMITQAALTARRNRGACLQLAEHARVVEGLLRKLQQGAPQLRRHPETRRPLEQLDAALRRAYLLVRSCGQERAARGYLYQLLTGAHTAEKLRSAEEEIDGYIRLIPVIGLVAAVHGPGTEEHGEDSAHGMSNDPESNPRVTTVSISYAVEPAESGVTTGVNYWDDTVNLINREMMTEHSSVVNTTSREMQLRDEDAPVQLHDALPHETLLDAAMADNFRELKIQEDDEATSSRVFTSDVQAHPPAESRGSTSTSDRRKRRDRKRHDWRFTRIAPRPVIKKTKKASKDIVDNGSSQDIVCYVCVVPRHVLQRSRDNKGKGSAQ